MSKIARRDFIRYPSNFDPDLILPPSLQKYGDYARFLLQLIEYKKRGDRRNLDSEYVPLKYDYLATYFPTRAAFSAVKKCLIDKGVIECDGQYIEGEKSFGYKICDAYKVRMKSMDVTKRPIRKKVQQFKRSNVTIKNSIHDHLYKCLEKIEIAGDEEEIPDELLISFLMIRDNYFFFKPDDYGRIHTNITNLSKALRTRLRVNGKGLVNMDIKNSQPLVFAALMDSNGIKTPDAQVFKEKCEAGIFYDRLMQLRGITQDDKNRGAFKKEFFRDVFYGRNKSTTENWKVFKSEFPSVADYIWQYKKGRKDEYKKLAHDLQKLESEIMIDGIIRACKEYRADIWVSTIHDSILTTPDHADEIRQIILSEFKKVGLTPKIDEEYLND